MNLYAYFRKYVWNDEKTPYFVTVGRLSQTQAKNEIFAFAVLLAMFTAVIAVAALLGRSFGGASPAVALYAFSVNCGAIALGVTRHRLAAVYCAAAPLIALFYFLFAGFPPGLHLIDELLLLAVMLGLLRYGGRITSITLRLRDMAAFGETE